MALTNKNLRGETSLLQGNSGSKVGASKANRPSQKKGGSKGGQSALQEDGNTEIAMMVGLAVFVLFVAGFIVHQFMRSLPIYSLITAGASGPAAAGGDRPTDKDVDAKHKNHQVQVTCVYQKGDADFDGAPVADMFEAGKEAEFNKAFAAGDLKAFIAVTQNCDAAQVKKAFGTFNEKKEEDKAKAEDIECTFTKEQFKSDHQTKIDGKKYKLSCSITTPQPKEKTD